MPTYTKWWNLEKPDRGQLDWDLPINANFDKLDKAIYQALNAHTGDSDDEELPLPDLPNRVLILNDSTNNMQVEIHQVYIPFFISEGFKQPALNGLLLGGFWIDKYQCCHPNATRFSRGTDTPNTVGTVAAASKPHVVPWTDIDWYNAKKAVENRNLITGERATGICKTYGAGSKDEFYVQSTSHLVGRLVRITQGGVTYVRRIIKQGIDTTADPDGAKYVKIYPPLPAAITGDGATAGDEYEIIGHHLVTPYEWFSVAAWAVKYRYRHGFGFPKGNNNWGKDYRDPRERRYEGIPDPVRPGYNGNDISRVLTGSGPLTWSLNGRASGVFDLNGNVWEWVDFLIGSEVDFVISKGYPGEGHVLPTTGATAGASSWVTELEDSTPELAELGIPKTLSTTPEESLDDMRYWLDETRTGERAAIRGGGWAFGAHAGLFSLGLYLAPSYRGNIVGFRGAF